MLGIREAHEGDFAAIWPIFQAVVAAGDTYPFAPDTSIAEAHRLCMEAPSIPFVGVEGARVLGAYVLKPNQTGLGDHVANCGYMTQPEARGRGVGSALCEHSIEEARRRGYTAMQFNFVVASNEGAIRLWKRHGFAVVGRVPGAFRHLSLGPVDVLIMHRML